MQLDPATLIVSPETTTSATTDAPAAGEPVPDIFAALLSALAPTIQAPETGTTTIPEGEAETPSGQPQPGHLLATKGQIGETSPQVMAGETQPTGHFEVQRDSRGLPLLATATATPMAAAGLAVPRPGLPIESVVEATTAAERPAGSPAETAIPTASELPTISAAVIDAGAVISPRTARRMVPANPGLTTASSDPRNAPLDGRPIPAGPGIGAGSGAKPDQIAVPVPDVDAGNETLPDTNSAPVKPGVTGGAETYAPSTDAAPPATGPEPRPAVWQPDVGATSPTNATSPTSPTVTVTAPEPAPVPSIATANPEATADAGTARPADPQQIQAQVLRQVLGRFDPADGRPQQITLKLNPEHLGKVEVRLTTTGGQLQVEFQAETAEAGVALREGQHELVRNLITQVGRWQQVEIKVSEPVGKASDSPDQEEERSEQGSRRERDHQQRRRQRGER